MISIALNSRIAQWLFLSLSGARLAFVLYQSTVHCSNLASHSPITLQIVSEWFINVVNMGKTARFFHSIFCVFCRVCGAASARNHRLWAVIIVWCASVVCYVSAHANKKTIVDNLYPIAGVRYDGVLCGNDTFIRFGMAEKTRKLRNFYFLFRLFLRSFLAMMLPCACTPQQNARANTRSKIAFYLPSQ